MKPSKSLSDNVYWNELACLTRLTLVANYLPRHMTHAQLYVPEAAHFVSLLAGTGQLLVRTSVYGVVVNLLHSMYLAKSAAGESTVSPEIQALLHECAAPPTLKMFGLRRPTPTSDYAQYDPVNDMQYLESLEQLSLLLVRIMEATAGSRGRFECFQLLEIGSDLQSSFVECLASSLDELGDVVSIPAFPCHPDARICFPQHASYFRC